MKPILTCMVAGIQYLLHPQKLGTIEATIKPDALLPVTLLTTDEIFGDLDGILQLFDDYDDVFTPEFGAILIEKPGGGNGTDASNLRHHGSTREVYHMNQVVGLADDMAELPSGPYFLHGPNLYQAWRLYDDELGAFTSGVIPDDLYKPDEFQVLSSLDPWGNYKSIPVPSRLYHPRPSPRNPLSGIRMAITDTLLLKGVSVTLSSRAWTSIFKGPASRTNGYTQSLLNMGAVIIGKTKVGQLGTGVEWVDEQAPWSPRGDAYQRMLGSSAGTVSALTGYEWLTHAVGDGGLGGFPSQQGIYSTSSSLKDDSRGLDKVRFFSRSLDDLLSLAAKSLEPGSLETEFPKRVLYPTDLFPTMSRDEHGLMNEVFSVLEKFLHVKVQDISLASEWTKTSPAEAKGAEMQEYMKDSKAPFGWDAKEYYETFDLFRGEYYRKFKQEPFLEATPKFLWNIGKNISWPTNGMYSDRIMTYRAWFDENIMSLKSTPNSEAIMVLPCQPTEVHYRDEPPAPPTTTEGVAPENLAPIILQAPHLTVPFAQLPYESRISGRTEYRPICVSIMGAPGSDVMMIQLVAQAFEHAKWRTQVDTGRLTFPLGNNSRNVKDGPQAEVESQSPSSGEL
ncbi:Fc.00g046820.m01.CDS01 [Cosmosporella sp. VM-42]